MGNNELTKKEKIIFSWYMKGFTNELDNKKNINIPEEFLSAYEQGVSDAIVGDDISSVDERTYDEIFKLIKERKNE